MRRLLSVVALGISVLVLADAAKAGKVEADPNHDYILGPECGEWLICATSYKGADGTPLAKQMVYHLRSKENLLAFVHIYHDETGREMQRALDERSRQLNLPRKRVTVEDQYAVLIGPFKDMDAARKALTEVKKLTPPKLKLGNGQVAEDVLAVAGPGERKNQTQVGRLTLNPFAMSFVTRNPTIARDTSDKPKYDPAWKRLNADESYSLLESIKPWTLVVKQYSGASYVASDKAPESSFLEKLGIGNSKSPDTLGAAYLNAHNLAEALHKMKFDAYVLHTRGVSYVTIGGFEGPDDPELKKMQAAFASSVKVDLKEAESKIKDPQGLRRLQLMNPPVPMQVPRP
ncbi:MAG TPA: hypothetical protein VGZ25_04590 [Gemmataceae bacterium]|nr:hypothetical protein [Gemmataceae bacterium]